MNRTESILDRSLAELSEKELEDIMLILFSENTTSEAQEKEPFVFPERISDK